MTYSDTDGTIRKRSGWLIPLGVFLVTAALSALVLLYYLAPTAPNFLEEQVSPTSRGDIVALRVHGLKLWIPANYLQYESARQGGARKDLALFAILPDMAGWSNWEASTFTGNTPDSPVVYMLIREESLNLTEADRLARIYLSYVTDPRGSPGPFGLTQYTFREDSGYRNEDLFVGQMPTGPVVLRCVRFSPDVPSPSCLRDLPIAHSVALSYRFKRNHLVRWREIGDGMSRLIETFKKAPRPQAAAEPQPRP
ncbi:MAG TPA: hypothetical protein VNU97_07805 [Rhizomicrobium sp.]|jgi:hypothetical protein|nr:hypothetical protein [Rhizomicrobium sp.]